ncbi:uncharacterized protein N7496_006614 [Penicillium cataractarum]|uniref:Uncharacterized protein n=1 Tax=Penicillium cataractarum TaxID=2100454 RepID=A0A9W9S1U7_9EURO|nr:uncharacterized protein N7496_006614 [Penicillium cataractarum]KAJ5370522.1 hypothetical protein N7496_006614 [Penicillium cataractarum]
MMAEQSHKQALLTTCAAGNLQTIQSYFTTYNTLPGSQVLWLEMDKSPPSTWKLVTAAITHENVAVITYLLSIYTVGDISYEEIASALIQHPNLGIISLLYAHSPEIVNLEIDPHRTLLTETCRGCRDSIKLTLPLLHFLLNHGADLYAGGVGASRGLLSAVESGQPWEVIGKMSECGASVNVLVFWAAARVERVDGSRGFFEIGRLSGVLLAGSMVEIAKGIGDEEVRAVVEGGIYGME